ncbi:MAG: hypothetical protein KatS3mg106_266 [Gemmataceae bacterium]|nr:MAG: hypothetical protein KatS3mg106_266 [Gemmataceae bacterium]
MQGGSGDSVGIVGWPAEGRMWTVSWGAVRGKGMAEYDGSRQARRRFNHQAGPF